MSWVYSYRIEYRTSYSKYSQIVPWCYVYLKECADVNLYIQVSKGGVTAASQLMCVEDKPAS